MLLKSANKLLLSLLLPFCVAQAYAKGAVPSEEKPYKYYSEWMTRSEMKRVPQSYMLDFSKKPKWSYVMGIELEGMLDTYLRHGGDDILDYCKLYTDTMISAEGNIRGYNLLDYNLDNIRTGHFVTRMYQLQPEEKNLRAMQTLMRQLDEQPRTVADKVFWHKAIYAYQVWLDGIFMGLPYRCLTAPITATAKERKKGAVNKIYDDAVNQLTITYNRTLDPSTGLNRHAYDENRNMFWADKQTGLSQHCWGRAQGWFSMALIEVLDAVPENYKRRGELIALLRKDLDAVLKWQDADTGLWYQVMDSPGREGNYLEATCSSMFAYVLLKAARKGYVDHTCRDAGVKAYKSIISHFIRENADQTISLTQCCEVAGLGPGISPQVEAALKRITPKAKAKENKRRDGSYGYYLSEPIRDNDAKGVGPFIWASLEMEQLGYDTSNLNSHIDRPTVLWRNNPVVTEPNTQASLSVGNGHFATTVDVTGLQSFPFEYGAGVPLTAMSDWAWHKFKNTKGLTPADSWKTLDLAHGHKEIYALEYKQPKDHTPDSSEVRHIAATEYFRVNPHRLNLGTIGLQFFKDDEKAGAVGKSERQEASLSDLTDISQELRLHDGTIISNFKVGHGDAFRVITACLPDRDALLCRLHSAALSKGRANITIRFPYPTGKHADDASNWTAAERHQTDIVSYGQQHVIIRHQLDSVTYFLSLRWQGKATLTESGPHFFTLSASTDTLSIEAEYLTGKEKAAQGVLSFTDELNKVHSFWHQWWQEGAFVDFSQCTDPRAHELERRVVLSQYLTQINCAGNMPPQETGLTYNSWFGRPHLEMAWWHLVDFALWNRTETIERMLSWYNDVAYPEARSIAQRQGFRGVRWMKMTDAQAGEAPSNTGSLLIWQQPHYIYLAEEVYRAKPTAATLQEYGEQVEETASFMADFATFDPSQHRYVLRGATAMQESMTKDIAYNQPFELAYWYYGLSVAQRWRERRGLKRHQQWDEILAALSPLPQHDGYYTAGIPTGDVKQLPAFNPFDNVAAGTSATQKAASTESFVEKSHNDHPAVVGACGMLPLSPIYNKEVMKATLAHVLKNWNWASTWGWDYGMLAMAAARLGMADTAVDFLLRDTQKNTYLPNGHNFQTADRLRVYLPGNGALLTAVAMMCAGWDGCHTPLNPGFPNDGTWNVRWEGIRQMQ